MKRQRARTLQRRSRQRVGAFRGLLRGVPLLIHPVTLRLLSDSDSSLPTAYPRLPHHRHIRMSVNDKRTLYVGGLEESVTEATLRAAFVPFGEVTEVNLPMDASSSKHKGFAFVQYDDKADAADAMDNMHNAELFGRVLRVNLAKPESIKGGHRPVWESQADDFFAREGAEGAEVAS